MFYLILAASFQTVMSLYCSEIQISFKKLQTMANFQKIIYVLSKSVTSSCSINSMRYVDYYHHLATYNHDTYSLHQDTVCHELTALAGC